MNEDSKAFSRKILIWIFFLGLIARFFVAIRFQSRSWTDEMGAVLNPAYLLKFGVGSLGIDFGSQARSWIPPRMIETYLSVFSLFGIGDGATVLPGVRAILAWITTCATFVFTLACAKRLDLKSPPWLGLFFALFSPELLRYAGFSDIAVLATPYLLVGLSICLVVDLAGLEKFKKAWWIGAALVTFSAVVRYQFGVFAAALLVERIAKKRYRDSGVLILCGVACLAIDILYNSSRYGQWVFPLERYYHYNIVQGFLAATGESPFYLAFEFFWRFATEFVAIGALLFGVFHFRGRDYLLHALCWIPFLLHAFIGHKEYRYFYPAALMLTVYFGVSLQKWIEKDLRDAYGPKVRSAAFALALILFISGAALRGVFRTQWTEFEVPTKLETWVGGQKDLRGLLVYGWQAIFQGGNYAMYRNAAYEFAEKREELKGRDLNATDYNYVVAEKSQPAPCEKLVREEERGRVYFCTETEIQNLIR